MYRRSWSKSAGDWTVVPVKADKDYKYISNLQKDVIYARLEDHRPMKRKREVAPEDPKKIAKTIAPIPPPPTSELAEKKITRFKSK